MFFYPPHLSHSPLKPFQNAVYIQATSRKSLTKDINPNTTVLLRRTPEKIPSENQPKSHRKSLTSYQGFFEETFDKRNRSFAKLEKTIQNVLDQNKRTKQLIKEFLTPYKERKNQCQKDVSQDEEQIKENTAQFPEEKEISFNTPIKEAEKKEKLMTFMNNNEDSLEEKPEFSLKSQNYLVKRLQSFQPEKCELFINSEEANLLKKIDFIEKKTGVNLKAFLSDVYEGMKNYQVHLFFCNRVK